MSKHSNKKAEIVRDAKKSKTQLNDYKNQTWNTQTQMN